MPACSFLAVEAGGRWSAESADFLRHLAPARTRTAPDGDGLHQASGVLAFRGCPSRTRGQLAVPAVASNLRRKRGRKKKRLRHTRSCVKQRRCTRRSLHSHHARPQKNQEGGSMRRMWPHRTRHNTKGASKHTEDRGWCRWPATRPPALPRS